MARILIVEDEPLIAMMLGEWLEELGHVAVGPASTIAQAMALVDAETLHAAILDVNLNGEQANAVADALRAKRVPFAVASGDSHAASEDHFKGHPVVPKPYDFNMVSQTLELLIGA
jgi:DNA-binding response OmpR family regulator